MRRITRLPRRILAISAATFVGALGAVALTAAPASAHHVTVTGKAVCGDAAGTAVVTWTVSNSRTEKVGTIREATREIAGLTDTEVAPQSSVSGSETVKIARGQISLGLKMIWDGYEEDNFKSPAVVDLSQLKCAPTEVKKPTYSGVSNCDGTITVTVKNTSDAKRTFSVNGDGKEHKDLEIDEKWVVTIPADKGGKVAVKWKRSDAPEGADWENKGDKDRIDWVKPEACFTATPKSTCEGLSITVVNTGPKAITVKLTVGDKTEETTIEPGKDDIAEIDGVDGVVAKLSVNGGTAQEFKWEKPADCSGGGLPVTGVNAGLLAGAALVLVSGGGGLFYMARRRRIRFAA